MINVLRKEVYGRYKNMKARCYDIKNVSYKNYGARNIKVCDEWLNKERI